MITLKAKNKFTKMYNKLPEKARTELVVNFAIHPMSLTVCNLEIRQDTELGKDILRLLGYEDD